MNFLTSTVTGFFLLGVAKLVCTWELTESHIIGGALVSIAFNGRGPKKVVLCKEDVVLPKRPRIQALQVCA